MRERKVLPNHLIQMQQNFLLNSELKEKESFVTYFYQQTAHVFHVNAGKMTNHHTFSGISVETEMCVLVMHKLSTENFSSSFRKKREKKC
jgi:hypothetical protein